MKRILPYLVAGLAVLLAGWWVQRQAGFRAVAVEQARVAQAVADSAKREAAVAVRAAAESREAIAALTAERNRARRAASATQTALHTLLDSVEVAAGDSSVARDSLARLVGVLAAKIRADSSARAKAEATADAERFRMTQTLSTQQVALDRLQEALRSEIAAHASTKNITRRSFFGKLASAACAVAITGASAEVGSKVYPAGGAAIGGGAGYLTSRMVCG